MLLLKNVCINCLPHVIDFRYYLSVFVCVCFLGGILYFSSYGFLFSSKVSLLCSLISSTPKLPPIFSLGCLMDMFFMLFILWKVSFLLQLLAGFLLSILV